MFAVPVFSFALVEISVGFKVTPILKSAALVLTEGPFVELAGLLQAAIWAIFERDPAPCEVNAHAHMCIGPKDTTKRRWIFWTDELRALDSIE